MSADLEVRSSALRRDMARRLCMFGFDEMRVVDRLMQRLELGRDEYGKLDLTKPRDWRRELREELLDALVYDLAEELAAEDAERAQLHEDARREIQGDAPAPAPAPRRTLTAKARQALDERARQAVAEFTRSEATRVSNEPARIAFADLGRNDPAIVELDDLDDRDLYAGFDLSDAEVS